MLPSHSPLHSDLLLLLHKSFHQTRQVAIRVRYKGNKVLIHGGPEPLFVLFWVDHGGCLFRHSLFKTLLDHFPEIIMPHIVYDPDPDRTLQRVDHQEQRIIDDLMLRHIQRVIIYSYLKHPTHLILHRDRPRPHIFQKIVVKRNFAPVFSQYKAIPSRPFQIIFNAYWFVHSQQ